MLRSAESMHVKIGEKRQCSKGAAARQSKQTADEDSILIPATAGVTEIAALGQLQLATAALPPPLTEEQKTLMSLFDSDDDEPPAPPPPPPNNSEATPTPQQQGETVHKRRGGRAKRCGSCLPCLSGNRNLKCEVLMARSLESAGSSCESDPDSQRSRRSGTPSSIEFCESMSEDGGSAWQWQRPGGPVETEPPLLGRWVGCRRKQQDTPALEGSCRFAVVAEADQGSANPPPPTVEPVTSSTSKVRFAKGSTPQPKARAAKIAKEQRSAVEEAALGAASSTIILDQRRSIDCDCPRTQHGRPLSCDCKLRLARFCYKQLRRFSGPYCTPA